MRKINAHGTRGQGLPRQSEDGKTVLAYERMIGSVVTPEGQLRLTTASVTGASPEKPSARAPAGVRSITRPRTNGPRSLMHDDRTSGPPIGDLHHRAERQRAMRCREATGGRDLASGGVATGVDRRDAGHEAAGDRRLGERRLFVAGRVPDVRDCMGPAKRRDARAMEYAMIGRQSGDAGMRVMRPSTYV